MLEKVASGISHVFFRLSALAMFLLCLIMLFEVIFRYIPGLSMAQPWVPGVLSLIDIWLIFMGSVVAMCQSSHLRITFFTSRMPSRVAKSNKLLVNVINLALLLIMTWFSIPIVETGMDLTFGGVPFSKGYSFIALPVCTSLMAIMVIRNIVNLLRENRRKA